MQRADVLRAVREFVARTAVLTVQAAAYSVSHRELQLLLRAGGPVPRAPLKLVFLGTSYYAGPMHCQGRPVLVELPDGLHEFAIEVDGGTALRIVAEYLCLSDFDPGKPAGVWSPELSAFYEQHRGDERG